MWVSSIPERGDDEAAVQVVLSESSSLYLQLGQGVDGHSNLAMAVIGSGATSSRVWDALQDAQHSTDLSPILKRVLSADPAQFAIAAHAHHHSSNDSGSESDDVHLQQQSATGHLNPSQREAVAQAMRGSRMRRGQKGAAAGNVLLVQGPPGVYV